MKHKGKNKKKSSLIKEPKEVAELNYTMLGMQISKGDKNEASPREELKEGEITEMVAQQTSEKEDSPPHVTDF